MKIKFHGAAGTVTGSCYELKSDELNICDESTSVIQPESNMVPGGIVGREGVDASDHSVICPNNTFLAGLSIESTANASNPEVLINQQMRTVQLFCRGYGVDETTISPEQGRLAFADATNWQACSNLPDDLVCSPPRLVECPPNAVVTGLHVNAQSAIDNTALVCSELSFELP